MEEGEGRQRKGEDVDPVRRWSGAVLWTISGGLLLLDGLLGLQKRELLHGEVSHIGALGLYVAAAAVTLTVGRVVKAQVDRVLAFLNPAQRSRPPTADPPEHHGSLHRVRRTGSE